LSSLARSASEGIICETDKFVIKDTKMEDPHLAVHTGCITAKDRVSQYPGVLHADDGLLFCSTCNAVLDRVRKSVIDKHIESLTHQKKLNQTNNHGKQQTIKTVLECKTGPQ